MVSFLRSAVRFTIIGVLCVVLVGISGHSIAGEYNEDGLVNRTEVHAPYTEGPLVNSIQNGG